jgi:hypothetical protein
LLWRKSLWWIFTLISAGGRIDCQGALAIYRGEVPDNVVNPKVLSTPAFLEKLAKYKAAYASKGRDAE